MAEGLCMNLLVVEDDRDEIELFQKELAKTPAIRATFSRSKASALAALKDNTFELVILDLRIPTQDDSLDEDADHGLAVHSFIREHAQGTPIVFFSAYGTLSFVRDVLEKSDRQDIWGTGTPQPLTSFKEKTEFLQCLKFINWTENQVAQLSEI